METNSNNTFNQENKNEQEPKKSWFERNLWMIATCLAIFILRMCSQISHN